MLNINELEQRWLRYKIKSYIPHAVIVVSLLLILLLSFLFLNNSNNAGESIALKTPTKSPTQKELKHNPLQKTTVPSLPKKEVHGTQYPKQSLTPQKMTIAPSLDFIKKMQSNTLSNYEYNSQKAYKPRENKNLVHKPKPIVQVAPTPEPKKEVVPVEKVQIKSNKIKINRQNEHDDTSKVIGRFNKNNNPALSLFVAKKYYELGDYHKSYNYALITNGINSDIEASWIIFAKSLVKLKKKDMAIKTLRKYIKHSNSNRANILLDDIITGKFK